jgi:hypothetical protein
MKNKDLLSQDSQDLLSFIKSLPSAKNFRVYSSQEQSELDSKSESSAVRRSILRSQNTKSDS